MKRPHVLETGLAHRSVFYPLIVFAALLFAGVGGFALLGNIGVVDASFWLLDPTSIELHYQEHGTTGEAVKTYAILVYAGLLITGLWIGETAVTAVFGGQIKDGFRLMKLQREIDELEHHVIVCGYGTFGKTIVNSLQDAKPDVVVIEQQESQFRLATDAGILAIEEDASRTQALKRAGVERASTVIGAIDDSKVNIQIAITASEITSDVELIVRAGDEADEALARRAGADQVVVPEIVSGEQVGSNL